MGIEFLSLELRSGITTIWDDVNVIMMDHFGEEKNEEKKIKEVYGPGKLLGWRMNSLLKFLSYYVSRNRDEPKFGITW